MMPKFSRDKGVRTELELAHIVGGKRNSAFSGKADVENSAFIFEVKVVRFTKRMLQDIEQARIKAIGHNKGACVAWKHPRPGQAPIWLIGHVGADEWQAEHGA